jgi:hypothetical protein
MTLDHGVKVTGVLYAIAAAIVILSSALVLFSTFMVYDDEGYVLFSLKNFSEHGRLYGEVYSQYGPFPYVFYQALHFLGYPFTHNAGRVLTVTIWCGSSIWLASLVQKHTRSALAGFCVLTAVIVYLWVMVCEPMHPGGIIVFTIAGLAGLLQQPSSLRSKWRLAASGAGCALLLLTKINVGAFATLSTIVFLLLHSENDRVRYWSPWIIAPAVAVLPLVLMRNLLAELPWVRTYAIVFGLSACPVVFSAAFTRDRIVRLRDAVILVLGAGGLTVLVLGAVAFQGTTIVNLIEGIILGPLRFPGQFTLAFRWPYFAIPLSIISSLTFGLAFSMRRVGCGKWADFGVAWIRIAAGAGAIACLLGFPEKNPNVLIFGYCAPFLWTFVWQLPDSSRTLALNSTWMALLLLGQMLHAYPVPGSQLAWASFLALPIAAVGTWDAFRWLHQRYLSGQVDCTIVASTTRLALLAAALLCGGRFVHLGMRYLNDRSIGLTGAEWIRVPDATVSAYRILTLNAVSHADMVFSLPGMFSWNLWSGLPAPTLNNVTHWFSLLSIGQQQAIIDSLEAHQRSCVIVQQGLIDFLRDRNLQPSGLLYDYVRRTFHPAFSVDGFQFCVRNNRPIIPFLTAELFQLAPTGSEPNPKPNSLLKLYLLFPNNQQVGSVELTTLGDRSASGFTLDAASSSVETTVIHLNGDHDGETIRRNYPFTLQGPTRVSIFFDKKGLSLAPERTLIVVRDPAGAEIGLVRLLP